MLLLNDHEIKARHFQDLDSGWSEDFMISPFVPEQVRIINNQRCVSYGLSSAGYDIRLGETFRNPMMMTVGDMFDPHNLEAAPLYDTFQAASVIIQPGCMILAESYERFKIPRDVMAICLGKSTYARMGLFVNVTPLEPSWTGTLTMELSNIGQIPIKVYANEGIAQLLFFQIHTPTVSYADRGGKYQGQSNVQTAKL